MNYMLHGRKLFTHPAIWAMALFLAVLQPLAFAAPPGGVSLNTPAEGDTLSSPGVAQFTWSQSDPPATWFLLTVIKDGNTFFTQWTPTNHLTAVNGLPGGNFSWWVRTWNPDGFGPWTGPAHFTVTAGSPAAVTLVSPPQGSVQTNSTITYTWTRDPSSTWYELFINKDGRLFQNRWFGPSDVTISGEDVNAVVTGHTSGSYIWWVRPWGPDGLGPWSSAATFTVQVNGEPGQVTLLSPANGSTAPTRTTMSWSQGDPAGEWFLLWINRNGTNFFQQWVQTNSFTFVNGMPSGEFSWWVRPWNAGGLGLWSSTSTFTVGGGAPTNTTLVSPIGGVILTNSVVDYTWTTDPSATWYELFINQNNSLFLNRWFSLSQLSFSTASDGTPLATATIPGHSTGTYNWWVRAWSPDGLGPWSEMGTWTRVAP